MSDRKSEKPNKTDETIGKSPAKGEKLGKGMGIVVTEPFCHVCSEQGHKEKLYRVEGLPEVAANPQAAKGAPRVVDCTGGCRYGLEPYFNPRSDGSFCYMLLRSSRNPEALVNHYWFKPEWIGPPLQK